MGVFARLLRNRKSKNTEETSAAETGADGTETERAAEENTAEAAETAEAGPRNTAETDEAATAPEAADSDGVGIPKQQSAGEAVDNEADKGART
ncbi:hypothetical protein ACFWR9_28215 [Streptomyces sp. NPDC058534]|uniref:hypothetical protein n=1 Tax=Streptomyces sp. NPDC058534 TaxID=3346541 RepID=UPI003654A2EC